MVMVKMIEHLAGIAWRLLHIWYLHPLNVP